MNKSIKLIHQPRRMASLIVVLLLIGIIGLEVILYLNIRWVSLARRDIANDQVRLKTLNRAQQIFPFNDEVNLELGRWWLTQAQSPHFSYEERIKGLKKAMNYLEQAIRLNPGSYRAHFYLAQVGQVLRFEEKIPFSPISEFKKAALLTTYNEEVYFQAGRHLFSLWNELSPEDKEITWQLLANVITPNNPDHLEEILPSWEYNGASEEVLNKLLPQDARLYRVVADYLARRGIKHELRLIKLAQAEMMEFDQARRLYFQALNQAQISQFRRAEQAFQEAYGLLQRIKFYQALIGEKLIEESDFYVFSKEIKKNIAFLRLSRGENFSSVKTLLLSYLDEEDDVDALENFINYLRQKMEIQGSKIANQEKFLFFYLESLVDYKKGAFSQLSERIRSQGVFIQDNILDFPAEVADLWRIVAESYLNQDFVYDSLEYFEKALMIKPKDMNILLGLMETYERLNREDKIEEVSLRIAGIIREREEKFRSTPLLPGKTTNFQILASRNTRRLKIIFDLADSRVSPLVGVIINGRIEREGFLKSPEIEVETDFKVGINQVEITSYNTEIRCLKMMVE